MLEDVVATRVNRQTCQLGVCSYVLETLEVVSLARNEEHYGATNLDISRMEVRWILEWEGPN